MPELAGSVPSNGQNARLDKLLQVLEGKAKIDWWVRIAPFAAIFVASSLGLVTWGLQQSWVKADATAALANANATAVVAINKALADLRSEMKENLVAIRAEGRASVDRIDAGKADRTANEKDQANQIVLLRERLAQFGADQKNTTDTLNRILRKIEEARSDRSGPFGENQRMPPAPPFPFVLKANGRVKGLRSRPI